MLQKGDWIKFPELAKTYRKLADDGGETFYNVTEGSLGYDILQDLKEKSESLAHLSQICHYMINLAKWTTQCLNPPTFPAFNCFWFLKLVFIISLIYQHVLSDSIIRAEDLTEYSAKLEEPLKITMRDGSSLYSPKAPSSGAVLSFILNLLDGM